MIFRKFAYRAVAAAVLVTPLAWSAPVGAATGYDDYYRVVDLPGDEKLDVRAGPSRYARVIGSLSFDARQIEAIGDYKRGWARITYHGREGWVSTNYLAEDNGADATTFRVVGLDSYGSLNIRSGPGTRYRVVGDIPSDSAGVLSCGPCKGSWCPIRYNRTDGWVHSRYLAVDGGYKRNSYADRDRDDLGDDDYDREDDVVDRTYDDNDADSYADEYEEADSRYRRRRLLGWDRQPRRYRDRRRVWW